MMIIRIAKDFSETPGPRSRDEGEFSGDEFLDTVLRPKYEEAVAKREKLLIDLDGTEGYATSFLEAAFGGLARKLQADDLLRVLEFKCEDEPLLIEEIKSYINEANATAA